MKALRLRAFDLVSKPFEPKQVFEAIRRATARCEMRLQASSNEFLEGLSKRLIESSTGSLRLNFAGFLSGKVNLDQIRAHAQILSNGLANDLPAPSSDSEDEDR